MHQFLLQVCALNSERQPGLPHLLAFKVYLQRSERIACGSRHYVHHSADTIPGREKPSCEYRQDKDVNNVGAESIPGVALAKHRDSAIVFSHPYPAKPVLAPR